MAIDTMDKVVAALGAAQRKQFIQPLRAQIDDMQADLGAVRGQLDEMQRTAHVVTPVRRIAWIGGFLLFVFSLPLYMLEVRTMLGLVPLTALTLSLIFWSFSLVLFLYGLGFIGDN